MPLYARDEVKGGKLARKVWESVRTHPGMIAGRPNAGNRTLLFPHNGATLPADLTRDFTIQVLKTFIPEKDFVVSAESGGHGMLSVVVGFDDGMEAL